MNRTFRVIWSRSGRRWITAIGLLSMTGWAGAGPQGSQITAGIGTVSQAGNTTTIRQASQDLSLNWQSFNIAANETVNFQQPNAGAIAVNRILANSASALLGHLNANGSVWLINPNGILFGKSAQVNVAGLTASTLEVSDASLMSSSRSFSGEGTGAIINQGSIDAAAGGYVALLGNRVSNEGVITARLGTIALAAGRSETLTFSGRELIHVRVDQSTLNDLADNKQLIRADGGQVIMTAGAEDSLLASAVNNTGVVQANAVESHGGKITLLAGMRSGTVDVSGTLKADSSGAGPGGSIETSGGMIAVASGARIFAGRRGSWLIDPTNLTIDAAAAATIANTLNAGTSVTEQTTSIGAAGVGNQAPGAGDINLNAAIGWTNAAADLTLMAYQGININAAVAGAGHVFMQAGGNLTIGAGATVTGNSGVTLGAVRSFVNHAGSAALSGGSLGRWLVYSATPTADTVGGLAPDFIQYAAPFQATAAQATGNGLLYSVAPAISISALNGAVQKPYDGNATATLTAANFTAGGLLNGDTLASMQGAYQSVDAATNIPVTSGSSVSALTVTNSAGTARVYGYSLTGPPLTASIGTITPASLSASIVGDPTKVYDGTTTATLSATNYQFSGFASGEGATVNQPSSVAYASASAGGQTVGATFAATNFVPIAGTKLSNYALPTAAVGLGTVLPAPLLISGVVATDKIYDGTFVDTLDTTHALVYGIIGSDSVALSTVGAAGRFATRNAGSGVAVSTSGFTLTGAQQADYQLVQPAGLSATIAPAILTINGVQATNRVYDGTTSDALNIGGAGLFGVLPADAATVALSSVGMAGVFSGKNVGAAVPVNASGFTLSGTSAANYVLVQPTGLAADITPAVLTVTLGGNPSKPYNGTTTADLSNANFTIAGFVAGESATLPQTTLSQYATSNAGVQRVTATLTEPDFAAAAGTRLSNYIIPSSVIGVGTITPAPLTGMIVGNPTKVYDSTVGAALTGANYTLSGFLPGEGASINQTLGAYAGPNAGVQPVTATLAAANYLPVSGTSMSNYALPTSVSGSGTIMAAQLAGYVAAGIVGNPTKFYDGTTAATLAPSNFVLAGFAVGQGASVTQTVGQYASANAGQQTVSSTLSGADFTADPGTVLSNYHLPTAAYGSGTIAPAPLSATIVNDPTRIYNGGVRMTLIAGNYAISGFAGTESAAINPSALVTYAGPNVGAQSIVAQLTPSAYTPAAGTLMSNYTLATSASGVGHITPAPLYVTGLSATNKVYDTTNVDPLNTASATLAGVIAGDAGNVYLGGSPTGAFGTIHAGTALPVTVSGYSISGTAASNYTLQPTVGLAADIAPSPLNISGVTANSKPYDATSTATLNTSSEMLVGLLGSDSVTLSSAAVQATFGAQNAGNGIKVTATGFSVSGGQASDYALRQPQGLLANITPALVSALITGNPTKVYDGSPSTTLTAANYTLQGFAAGEGATVPQSASASYVAPDAGTGIGISSGLVLSDFAAINGTNLANYQLPLTGSGTGTITQAPLAAVIIGNPSKGYDHTTSAVLTSGNYVLSGFVGGQAATVTQTSGFYAAPDAGSQSVSATLAAGSFSANSGTHLNNYALPTSAAGMGTINRAPLSVTGTTTTPQVYDGTTVDALGGVMILNGTVYGSDTPSLTNNTTGVLGNAGNVGSDPVTTHMSLTGAGSANYILAQPSNLSAVISPAPLSAAASAAKTYDGTVVAPLSGANTILSGFVAGQGATVSSGVNGTFASPNAGTGIAVAGALSAGDFTAANGTLLSNYTLPTADDGTGTIRAATLTYNAAPSSFVYGTSPFGLTGSVSGFVHGETLATATTGMPAFDTAATSASNVGRYAIVGSGLSANNANYILSQAAANATALTITGAPLSVIGVTTTSRLYDGTAIDALSGARLTGTFYNNDHPVLTNDTTGVLRNSGNVGTDLVTTTMGLSGTGSGNYSLAQPGPLSAVISPLSLSASATVNKVYDGTTAANLGGTNTVLTGFVAGQGATVKNSVTGTFTGPNVGTAIPLTGGALGSADLLPNGGTLLSNYALPSSDDGTGSITAASINLSGARPYDAATDAAAGIFGSAGTVNGVHGENLILSGVGSIAAKNAGTRALVSLGTLSLQDGTGLAGNYTLAGGIDTVTVARLGVAVAGVAANRSYTGGLAATGVALASPGVLPGDHVVFSAVSALFDTKDVGLGKTVSFSGISASGADAGNYTVNPTATALADITPLGITVTGTAASKVYDGTTAATATALQSNGVIAGDMIHFAATGAAFSDKNAANGKTVTISGITASGPDSANYMLNSTAATALADIAPRAITVLAGGKDRVYDGTVADVVSLAGLGVIPGDRVALSATSANFSDKNVGLDKVIAVTGIGAAGPDAGNYVLNNASATAIASIAPLPITVNGVANNKVYDGTANATLGTLFSAGVIVGDAVTFSAASASFSDKNAAIAKTVTMAGITDAGTDSANYVLKGNSAITTANITARPIVVSGAGTDRVYDGTTADIVTLSAAGVLPGDVVSLTDHTATFANKNIGTDKIVSIDGIKTGGADAANYAPNVTAATSASILPAVLIETATPVSVPLGQTPVLTGMVSGFVAGDALATATTGKLVWAAEAPHSVGVFGISGGGLIAPNYVIEQAPANAAALTVTAEFIPQAAVTDRVYGLIALPLSPDMVATPYGVGTNTERSNNTGNAKRDPDPTSGNRRLTDFKNRTGLTVVGSGVRGPGEDAT